MFDILDMMDTMTRLHVEYVGHDGLLVDMVDLLEMDMLRGKLGNVRNIAKGTTG